MTIQRISPQQIVSLRSHLESFPQKGIELDSAYNYDIVSLSTDGTYTTATVIRRKFSLNHLYSNPFNEEVTMEFRYRDGRWYRVQ